MALIMFFNAPHVREAHVAEIADAMPRQNGAVIETITNALDSRRAGTKKCKRKPLFALTAPAHYRMIEKPVDPIEECPLRFALHSRSVLWKEFEKRFAARLKGRSKRAKYELICDLIEPGGPMSDLRQSYEEIIDADLADLFA